MGSTVDQKGITFLTLSLLLLLFAIGETQAQENLWIQWAIQTNTSAFCLHLTAATNPFKTCLIGVPVSPFELAKNVVSINCTARNASYCLGMVLKSFKEPLPWDPQELNLLDSRPSNGSGCVFFGSYNLTEKKRRTWLTPHKNYNTSQYCSPDRVYGWGSGHIHLNYSYATSLPHQIYLICGDRAWQGIPKEAHGGACYLGKLALLAPSKEQWQTILHGKTQRARRSLEQLPSDCSDEVSLWGTTARVFAAIIPQIAAEEALTQLQHLACWTAKQANVTTNVLSQLAQDMSSMRKAVLQNRAAIDYLLLVQGKGCEEDQGLCCFNLSDHSESIQEQLKWLKEHTKRITVSTNPLDDWLLSLGLSAWVKDVLKWICIIVLIIGIVLCMAPCIIQCFASRIHSMADAVFDKRGGDVAGLTGAVMWKPFFKKMS
ncbi:syncytin-2-like [Manacus vitellinus]|uniref:syncytin-2-like n=1 Tax=Manacus vitellinus TaxID=328815 RepID=UPI00115C6BB0|nr:syncytin-2-like [Manacus vitellinus]